MQRREYLNDNSFAEKGVKSISGEILKNCRNRKNSVGIKYILYPKIFDIDIIILLLIFTEVYLLTVYPLDFALEYNSCH